MSRTLPTECEHGVVIDWGDFGPSDDARPSCARCDADRQAAAEDYESRLRAQRVELRHLARRVEGQRVSLREEKALVARWKGEAQRFARERDLFRAGLLHYTQNFITCPCGARSNSIGTHPHVGGCPVGEALAIMQRDESGVVR